jgi:hypothetical protein
MTTHGMTLPLPASLGVNLDAELFDQGVGVAISVTWAAHSSAS